MAEITLFLVCGVVLYQAMDIFQRRAIDGIDGYRAMQALQLKTRYDSCLKNLDRVMQKSIKLERELHDLSTQSFATAGQIDEMVAQFHKGLEEVNEQVREEFFIHKAMVRLPDDKG